MLKVLDASVLCFANSVPCLKWEKVILWNYKKIYGEKWEKVIDNPELSVSILTDNQVLSIGKIIYSDI